MTNQKYVYLKTDPNDVIKEGDQYLDGNEWVNFEFAIGQPIKKAKGEKYRRPIKSSKTKEIK